MSFLTLFETSGVLCIFVYICSQYCEFARNQKSPPQLELRFGTSSPSLDADSDKMAAWRLQVAPKLWEQEGAKVNQNEHASFSATYPE